MVNSWHHIIDYQVGMHRGMNIFHHGGGLLKFPERICREIEKTQDGCTEELLEYTVGRVIQEFYRINQYYRFDEAAKAELKEVYRKLYGDIKEKKVSREVLARQHFDNLGRWLSTYNSFAGKVYPKEPETVEAVACFEYSAELQLKLFRIDLSTMAGPVLDVGCGEQGNLVRYLRSKGVEAFGIERLVAGGSTASFSTSAASDTDPYTTTLLPYIEGADWLSYEYGIGKWGTVISNLGFSNHFNHHHLRSDGDYMGYARKYMEILRSLKTGGSFYYAPGLPFIEKFLGNDEYRVQEFELETQQHQAVRIEKVR